MFSVLPKRYAPPRKLVAGLCAVANALQFVLVASCGSVTSSDAEVPFADRATTDRGPLVELRVIVDKTGQPVGMRLAKLRDESGNSLAQINEPGAQRLEREPSFASEVREQLGESSGVAIAFFEGERSPLGLARPAGGSQLSRSELSTGGAATDPSLGENGKQIAALAFAEEITARGDSILAEIDAALNSESPTRSVDEVPPMTAASEEEEGPCPDQREALNRDRRHLVEATAAAIIGVVALAIVPAATLGMITWAIAGGLATQASLGMDMLDSIRALKRCKGH